MRSPVGKPGDILAVLALVLLTGCTGCAQVVTGTATAAEPLPTAAVAAPDTPDRSVPLATDDIAATTTAALQEFWREAFPGAFGRPWRDITGFTPVDPAADPADGAPPCVNRAADLAGQAFYCPAADAVVWDAVGLIPDLRTEFGPAGVTVVLAHEIGHAVQTRLGIDEAQAADPARYPTILLEAMADCYAGVALAHLVQHPVAGLPVGPVERDEALLALVGFRDPLGIEPGDETAHGNAFDRVSAFQDGDADGAGRCAEMSLDNRAFTQRRFGSDADRARGGDLPLPQLLAAAGPDARSWFTTIGAARSPGWTAPELGGGATDGCPGDQGPVGFCRTAGAAAIVVDRAELAPLHRDLGDYADATLVASRYGLATLAAAGVNVDEPAAGAAAVCLAGAYTSRLTAPGVVFTLSPGDLDEAVQVLLAGDWAARDIRGRADAAAHGFERVARFRTGFRDGPESCLPAH